MNNVYVYDAVVPLVAEDNKSLTQKRIILPVKCEDLIPTELQGLWNNNLCSQDEEYCRPWIAGDVVYAQFIVSDPAIIGIFPTVVNGITGEYIWIPNEGVKHQEGSNEDGKRYANFFIDTDYLPEGVCCFYVKWDVYYDNVDFGDFSECYAIKVGDGQTELEAIHNCLAELLDPASILTHVEEPYCFEKCRPTIVVQGLYPGYDCNDNWYGDFGSLKFVNQFRIHGEIAKQSFGFSETLINNKKKSSKQVSTWSLRTPKIPPYMAELLAVAFNSETLLINGAEFRKAEEITKNNEDGFMWIVNTTLTTECDEISFTCV